MTRRAAPLPSVPAAPQAPIAEADALVCSYCGAVRAFDAGITAAAWTEALAGGFVVHRHRLVIFGRCASCRTATRAEALS